MITDSELIRRLPELEEQIAAESDQSLISRIGAGTLTGIGMLGNALDVPGSMIRDTLNLSNPFDQLLSPLSAENRTSGRELLTNYGITSENKETGWVPLADPGEFAQDALGFGAEVALDPLGWLAGWAAKGAGKAAAKNSVDNVSAAAAKTAGPISRGFDKATSVMDKLDPGFQIGRKVESAYGDTIRRSVKPTAEKLSAVAKLAKTRSSNWLHKYDIPRVSEEYAAGSFSRVKQSYPELSDAKFVNQYTPEQKLARDAAAAFGADLHFFAAGEKQSRLNGYSEHLDGGSLIFANADRPMEGVLGTIGHEILHSMRTGNEDAYKTVLANIIRKQDFPEDYINSIMGVVDHYPGDQQIEEIVAQTAGNQTWNQASTWQALANSPETAPEFRRTFENILGNLDRHLTKQESDVLREEISMFMLGQRDTTQIGGQRSSAMAHFDKGFVKKEIADDIQPYPDFTTPERSRTQSAVRAVDDVARRGAKTMVELAERIGRGMQSAMNYKVRGKQTTYGQNFGRIATGTQEELMSEFRAPVYAISDYLLENDLISNPEIYNSLRSSIELKDFQQLPDDLQPMAKHLSQVFSDVQSRATRAGLRRTTLDDVIEYFPRKLTPNMEKVFTDSGIPEVSGSGRARDLALENSKFRTDLFRGFINGTDGVNSVIADPQLMTTLRSGVDGLSAAETRVERAAELIKNKFSNEVDPRLPYQPAKNSYMIVRQDGTVETLSKEAFFKDYSIVRPEIFDRSELIDEYKQPLMAEGQFLDPETGEAVAQQVEVVTHLSNVEDVVAPTRYEALAKWLSETEVLNHIEEQGGIFTNNSLADAANRLSQDAGNIAVAEALPRLFSQMFDEGNLRIQETSSGIKRRGAKLRELFDHTDYSHIDPRVVLENMQQQSSKVAKLAEADEKGWTDILLNGVVDKEYLDDIMTASTMYQLPKSVEEVSKLFQSSTSAFKVGVLTAPARYTRDFFSGQIANWMNDMFSGAALKSSTRALFRQPDDLLATMPQVQDFAVKQGMVKKASEVTPEIATQAVRSWYAALKGDASHMRRDIDVDSVGSFYSQTADAESIADALPGTHNSLRSMTKEVLDNLLFRKGSKNPINIEGVQYFTGDKAKQGLIRRRGQEGFEEFSLAQAGNILGKNSDDMNRMTGFIEGMRRGKSGEQAFADMTRVQLDYRPQTFGPLEQVALKKIFPFYSFFSRQSVFLVNELLRNPTGKLGKAIRLQSQAGSTEDQYVPEHVRSQTAIPLSDSADGGKTYLTGLGLMHEDPIATVMSGIADPQSGIRNILSKSNPILKGFAEYGLGRSSFQGGPMGGRDLEDMDPVIGRILSQVGLQDDTPSGRAAPVFGSRATEFIASNSPLSRAFSTIKSGLDDRKSIGQRFLNLTTGLRFTTVSPEQSRSALRDISNSITRDLGARAFETFHISDELLEYVKEKQPEKYETLLAVQEMRKRWDRERRIKRKAEKTESAN